MSVGLVAFFVVLSVLIAFYAVLAPQKNFRINKVIDGGEPESGFFNKWVRPAIRNFLPQTPLALTQYARKNGQIAGLLSRAGNPWRVTPEEYVAVRILSVIFAVMIFLFAAVVGYLQVPLIASVGFGLLIGTLMPEQLLKSKWNKRKRDLESTLPEALDILRICMNAGYNFSNGLEETVQLLPKGATKGELSRVASELRAGRTTEQALQGLANRCPTDGVESFVRVISQAQATGVDIASTLSYQADEARADYERQVDVKAQKMQTTLFFPIIGLLLPVLMVIMFAPSVSTLQDAL
jgi:tight adherence protein C